MEEELGAIPVETISGPSQKCHYFGIDDNDDHFSNAEEIREDAEDTPKFSASPVLISCLRDIARKSKSN